MKNEIKEASRLFFRFNGYLIRYWKFELLLAGAGAVSILLSLANPYLAKIILDNGILGKNLTVFLHMILISGGVYILRQATDRGDTLVKLFIARKVRIDLAKKVLKKTRDLSLKSFQNSSASESVSRLNTDISVSSNIISAIMPDMIKAVLRIVCITAIIFFINKNILFLIIAYQAIALMQVNYFTRKSDALMKAAYEKSREMGRVLSQVFFQLYFVKASGKMAAMMRRYFRAFAQNMRIEVKASKADFFSDMTSDVSDKIFFGVVGFIGTVMVIKGSITLGGLTAVMAYMSQGSGAFTSLVNLLQRLALNRLPLERVAAILDAGIDIKEKDDAKSVDLSSGRIEFKDVSFEYTKDRRVIDRLSFSIAANDKVALVGSSGRGKTTIVNLILRLYDVNEGKVLLNDRDVRDMKLKSIYDGIALAPQSPFITGDTIGNNIAHGGSHVTDEAVKKAAALSEIHDFIEGLPDKYNTVVGEMVSTLSHGQKQRIAIARALVKNPNVLILDEACSSLDSATEDKIIDNILEAFPLIILIVVTHRLSTVKKMNGVYFLKSAGVMSVSGHDWMLETDPEYAELFASQIYAGAPCTSRRFAAPVQGELEGSEDYAA